MLFEREASISRHWHIEHESVADVDFDVSLEGDGKIHAVGSGDHSAILPFNGTKGKTFHGRALIVVERDAGNATSALLVASENGFNGKLVCYSEKQLK
ncbi:hypothetical protein [Bifidobacterium sp. ESL0732]|uniref:hypothetical protein n=1 Tax=Bifidobacterium sp. ESL0732 TaxID=2983222 RepID=UPI0023FA3268|nr:hypothetical protein [Bifidobacterium sp. ESL0732]WEV63615.1 hypothetical protein OZX70_06600 [Bifidobacterium sp. ESL0732]